MKILAILAAVALASPAYADCARIEAVMGKRSAPELQEVLSATRCHDGMAQGGAAFMACYWSFGFRDAGASAFFDGLRGEVLACVPAARVLEGDQQVNHPDSYGLARFEAGPRVLSVSLKDKGALGQTLVFLRVD